MRKPAASEHPLPLGTRLYLKALDVHARIEYVETASAVPGYVYYVKCEHPMPTYRTLVHSTDSILSDD